MASAPESAGFVLQAKNNINKQFNIIICLPSMRHQIKLCLPARI
jgi:hypothetical protein